MKTASCVLLFSLGMPAMPVDTHVLRVMRRTGAIGASTGADAAHEILETRLGERLETLYPFHLNVIRHGRETCQARAPKCGRCSLADICDFNLSMNHE